MNGLSEAVLVCKGELSDPTFSLYLAKVKENLQKLLKTDKETFLVSKLEKWNSVRVTFHLPGSAARRLHRLARHQPQVLHRLGVHSVQVEGNDTVSITFRERPDQHHNVAGASADRDLLSSASRVESGLGSSRASSDANGQAPSTSGVSLGASSSNTPHSCDVSLVTNDVIQGHNHDVMAAASCSQSSLHEHSPSGSCGSSASNPVANMEQMVAAGHHRPTSLQSSSAGNNSSPLLVNLLRTSSPGAGASVAHPLPSGQYGAVVAQQQQHAPDPAVLAYHQQQQQQLQHQQQQQLHQQQQQPPFVHPHLPPNYAPQPPTLMPTNYGPPQRFMSHPPGGATIAYQPPPPEPPPPKKRKKPTKKQQKELELQQMQQQGYFATSAAAAAAANNAHTVDRPGGTGGPPPMATGNVLAGGSAGPAGPGQVPGGPGVSQNAPPPGYVHYYHQQQQPLPQQMQVHHHGYPPGYHQQQQQQQQLAHQQQWAQQQHHQQQQQQQQAMHGYPQPMQQQHPQQHPQLQHPQQQQQQAWGSSPQQQMSMHMQHSQQQHGYTPQYPQASSAQYPQGYHHPQSSVPSSHHQQQQPSPIGAAGGGATYPPHMLRAPQQSPVAPLSFQQPQPQMTSSPSMLTSSPMADDRPPPTTPSRKQPSTPANAEHIDTTIDAVIQSAAAEARMQSASLLSAPPIASAAANTTSTSSSFPALAASASTAYAAVPDELAMISDETTSSMSLGHSRSMPIGLMTASVADQTDAVGSVQKAPSTNLPHVNGRDSPLMAKHSSSGLLNGLVLNKMAHETSEQYLTDVKPPLPVGLSVQIPSASTAPPSSGNFLRPSPAGSTPTGSWTALAHDDGHLATPLTAPPVGGRRNRRKADLSQEASPQDDEIIMATGSMTVGGRSQGRRNNTASNCSSLSSASLSKQSTDRKSGSRKRAGSRDSSSGSSSLGSKRQSLTPCDSREPSPIDLSQPLNCRQSVDLALHQQPPPHDHLLLSSSSLSQRATPSNGDASPSSNAPAASPVPSGSALQQNARSSSVRRSKR